LRDLAVIVLDVHGGTLVPTDEGTTDK